MADYLTDAQRRRRTGDRAVPALDPNAPGMTWPEALMTFAPYGAIARGVGMGLKAAARAGGAPAAVGGLLGMTSSAGEARGRKGEPDPADVTASQALPPHLRGQYLDLVTRGRQNALTRSERGNLKKMEDLLAEQALADRKAALERTSAADKAKRERFAGDRTRAEEARDKVMATAPKSFSERFPEWSSVQPLIPAALGALTMLPIVGRAARGASKAAGEWRGAVEKGLNATDAPTLAQSHALAQGYAKQFPTATVGNTLKGYTVPGAIGAVEGAGVTNIPDAFNAMLPGTNPEVAGYQAYLRELPPDHPDRARIEGILQSLPQSNPARDAAIAYFSNPQAVLGRTLAGAGEGAAGASLATTMGKWAHPSASSLPRAGTEALEARMLGQNLDPAVAAIARESDALKAVLPIPPARTQLPAPKTPKPRAAKPQSGLMDDLPAPPRLPPQLPASPAPAAPPALPGPAATVRPGTSKRFGALAGPAVVGATMARPPGEPDPDEILRLVQAGVLPPSALQYYSSGAIR